jgi:hypothetical protein
MRASCIATLAFTACYAPAVPSGAPCDPGRESCPTGQTCQPIGNGNFCSAERAVLDAGLAIDADPGTKPTSCYGSADGLLGRVCLAAAPTAPVTLAAGSTVNTSVVGAGNCTEIRAQAAGGPPLCIVAGTAIDVGGGAPVRAIGPNPLVVIAVQTIVVVGALDASSRIGDAAGATGAGARTASSCAATGIDGASSSSGSSGGGGGGGAGGSFGGSGAAGGNGKAGAAHGNPAMPGSTGLLVGGCPGGRGGHGAGNCPVGQTPCGGGPGGSGGGAIYLIAGGSIAVEGVLDASGQGGAGGRNGLSNSGGGGGGGAGGFIGLDAPRITITGSVFANGGGGGGGAGASPDDLGQAGADPAAAGVAGPGGLGGLDHGAGTAGGNGGAGATGKAAPAIGKPGTGPDSAGGAGGGGAGIVRIFGVPASSVSGVISPPPT